MICPDRRLHWTSAGATDPGQLRRVNEDAYLDRPDIGLWAVADGMGGHAAGDLASRLVVQGLESAPQDRFFWRFVANLRNCLGDAHRWLCAEARHRRVPVRIFANGEPCFIRNASGLASDQRHQLARVVLTRRQPRVHQLTVGRFGDEPATIHRVLHGDGLLGTDQCAQAAVLAGERIDQVARVDHLNMRVA